MNSNPEISVVIPCLDEENSIGPCLDQILQTISHHALSAEIVVVDNDSHDTSLAVITGYQKKYSEIILVREPRRGYGAAYLAGFAAARGRFIFMADADSTYDFSEIPRFIESLKQGYDMVVGNRFAGQMEKRSMSWLHRYIGNPFLSYLAKRFSGSKVSDINCGARALSKEAIARMQLQTTGMEFASEMIINASKLRLNIAELPIGYRPRIGTSKLRSFADGWRHIRLILLGQ